MRKRIIYILIVCLSALFLWSCGDDEPIEPHWNENGGITPGGAPEQAPEAAQEIGTENPEHYNYGNNYGYDSYGRDNNYGEEEPAEYAGEGQITHVGLFVIETPAGEDPLYIDDGIIVLPGGGVITAKEDILFTLDSGAILEIDENVPFMLFVNAPFRLPAGETEAIITSSPEGFIITLDGYAEESEPRRPAPWTISFDRDRNAVFEFASGVRFVSLGSVFPVFRDEQNGVILFMKCIIEMPDGSIIDAPLNTLARIADSILEIQIGLGDGIQTHPDGTVTVLPSGTLLKPSFD